MVFLHSTQCLAYEIKKCERKYSNAAKLIVLIALLVTNKLVIYEL